MIKEFIYYCKGGINLKYIDMDKQIKRRKQLFSLYREFMGEAIDDNGGWHGNETEMNVREKIWHCLALLEGSEEQIKRANTILGLVTLDKCHFGPMNCMQLLLKHESSLTPKVIEKLEKYVEASLERLAGSNIHFTMYNDNFASMAAFTLLTAGERFGNKKAFNAGAEKLNQLKERYMRCGVLMEYCSTTYLSITILCMAEIFTYVKNQTVRDTAIKCEERAWAEAASHYHAPSGHLAGPYSRAYTVDTLGHPSGLLCLLYTMFGDDIIINPVKDMFPYRKGLVIHHGLERLMWPSVIWSCSGLCHCPEYMGEMLLQKTYPYTAIAKAECLPSLTDGYRIDDITGEKVSINNTYEYQGTSGPIYTYMTEEYAMGTAHSQYHDGGLTESFHLVYRKKAPAHDITDAGVVFSRYIINEKLPESIIKYSVYGEGDGNIGFRDEGRKFGIQHKDCSVMAYKPKQFEAHNIWSMKLSLLFPCHFSKPCEIWLGREKLDGFSGESRDPVTVFVRDGSVYMAYTPLQLTDHGRKAAVKVEQTGNYIMISFYNYEDRARPFDNMELFLTSSGFIANMKSADEIGSFDLFMKYINEYSLEDNIECSQGSYTRWIRYKRNDLDINFAYSPVSEGIMISAINGRPRPDPVFYATGINNDRLPFLQD